MLTFIQKPSIESYTVVLLSEKTCKDAEYYDQLQSMGFTGKYRETCLLPSKKIIALGVSLTSKTKVNDAFFKVDPYELGAAVSRGIEKTKITKLHIQSVDILVDMTMKTPQDVMHGFLIGLAQGRWDFDTYKKDKVEPIEVSCEEIVDQEYVMRFSNVLASVRELVEETPEEINPESYQKFVEQNCSSHPDVNIRIIQEEELKELGMNGVLAVGRAGAYRPRIVHATYTPRSSVKKRICFVGKGVTYDSGGLDVKTGGYMKGMKMDMGGAATMYGVFKQLSEVGLEHTEIHYITGLVENMISPDSYKPDDIYTSYSGLTVEVGNTDAEGRITLGDLLTYATEQQPDYIIDAATLTGAAIRSLTVHNGVLIGNDAELNMSLLKSFKDQNERLVDEPMGEFLRERMKGDKSDLQNIQTGTNTAGHITAGVFLSNFVEPSLFRNQKVKTHDRKEGYAWAHIDLAGPASNNKKNTLQYNGATGYGVRSLVDWVLKCDAE